MVGCGISMQFHTFVYIYLWHDNDTYAQCCHPEGKLNQTARLLLHAVKSCSDAGGLDE